MSEKRFWFVIDKGKLDYVQDNVAKEKITVTELEDLLNALNDENRELRQTTKTQQIRIYCQDKEIQKLNEQLNKIPNTIKEVWIE